MSENVKEGLLPVKNFIEGVLLFIKGMLIGIANVIPGVSGGTLAVILGIYDRLIASISGLFDFKDGLKPILRKLIFIAIVGVGAVSAIGAFAKLFTFLIDNHNVPTMFFFMGLIAGSVPLIFKKAKSDGIKAPYIISFAAAFAFLAALSIVDKVNDVSAAKDSVKAAVESTGLMSLSGFGISKGLKFLVSGIVSAAAMVVPGISGSFILLLIGAYGDIFSSVSALVDSLPLLAKGELALNTFVLSAEFFTVAITGVGMIIGIVVITKIIEFLLERYHSITYSAVLGLILASFIKLWPAFDAPVLDLLLIAPAIAVGFLPAFILGSRSSAEEG